MRSPALPGSSPYALINQSTSPSTLSETSAPTDVVSGIASPSPALFSRPSRRPYSMFYYPSARPPADRRTTTLFSVVGLGAAPPA